MVGFQTSEIGADDDDNFVTFGKLFGVIKLFDYFRNHFIVFVGFGEHGGGAPKKIELVAQDGVVGASDDWYRWAVAGDDADGLAGAGRNDNIFGIDIDGGMTSRVSD